jgi:lysophospholipase L1-like esterase
MNITCFLPRLLVATVALLVAVDAHPVAQTPSSNEHWVATWATSQTLVRGVGLGGGRGQAPAGRAQQGGGVPVASTATSAPAASTPPQSRPGRRFPIPPGLSGVNGQTIRMIVRASVGGRRARVRLSNAFAGASVQIGAARVARSAGGSAIDPLTSHALTFSGQPGATLYAGQVLVSDPVDLVVPALADLAVSIYFPGDTGQPTTHLFGLRSTYISTSGDFTNAAEIASPSATTQSYYWLAGLDVLAPATAGTIVAFGDSITDGDQSTPETLAAWPTRLAARLQANRDTAHLAVVNAGIAGNRILGDNGGGLARLVNDVLSQPGVKWIILLEGINDITAGVRQQASNPPFVADDLIAAYRQVIEQAHLRNIRVAGATLTPFGGSSVYSDAGERIRSTVNSWIRTSGAFDAVIDFDQAVRDPRDPSRLRVEADSPDFLHPGDAGYRLMGDAIDLNIFTTAAPARR